MGRKRGKLEGKSYTLPPSPSHSHSSSSSSSDFEFSISISPRKSSSTVLQPCPADELFYKGQLLPLQLSPRISMVRTLLLSSTTTAPRDSTASTSSSNDSSTSSFASDLALFPDCDDSSRPSNATHDNLDDYDLHHHNNNKKPPKYLSFSRFSSVFRPKTRNPESVSTGSSVKEVIRKYIKKVKPFYEKFSQKQQQQRKTVSSLLTTKTERSAKETLTEVGSAAKRQGSAVISHSFSGNLRYPLRRRSCVSSCPSSMRSSPSHSGVLPRGGSAGAGGMCYGNTSTTEELQSAIQGAIAHCKNSLIQNKTMVSNEI